MWKLILKNLWSRRRRNGWLLAELILVAILSWYIFDPVMVVTYERHLPLGYDADRLCMVSVGMLPQEAPGYEPQAADSASLMQTYLNLVDPGSIPMWNRQLPFFLLCILVRWEMELPAL